MIIFRNEKLSQKFTVLAKLKAKIADGYIFAKRITITPYLIIKAVITINFTALTYSYVLVYLHDNARSA